MHVAFGLFSWSMMAGLLAFSSRQFAPTMNHGLLPALHDISILSSWACEAGGECRPRSKAFCSSYSRMRRGSCAQRNTKQHENAKQRVVCHLSVFCVCTNVWSRWEYMSGTIQRQHDNAKRMGRKYNRSTKVYQVYNTQNSTSPRTSFRCGVLDNKESANTDRCVYQKMS